MPEIKLSALIPPAFHSIARDIKASRHMEYWLKGGRGSGKSSFAAIMIILGMMRDKNANAAVLRKVRDTMRESVFEQLVWAAQRLGVSTLWQERVSPMSLTYLPTGQRIIFRGMDNTQKVKSAKLKSGYFKYVWFEELSEFSSYEEVRGALLTFVRGGDNFAVIMTYNPPMSVKSWVNCEVAIQKPTRLVHHSTYLDVLRHPNGASWLGEAFVTEASHRKKVAQKSFEHEYMGKATGTGGEVFANVELREVTDREIADFDPLHFGIDWGYAVDPFAFVAMHYDKKRRQLTIFDEIFAVGLSNREATARILPLYKKSRIVADSAEPKSIDELCSLGLSVRAARKGAGSVSFGIKWLAALESIVIDPARCPAAAREFTSYEYPSDGFGGFRARLPDKDNHCVDATRYALEGEMRGGKSGFRWVR